jgi:hypothetical protein
MTAAGRRAKPTEKLVPIRGIRCGFFLGCCYQGERQGLLPCCYGRRECDRSGDRRTNPIYLATTHLVRNDTKKKLGKYDGSDIARCNLRSFSGGMGSSIATASPIVVRCLREKYQWVLVADEES